MLLSQHLRLGKLKKQTFFGEAININKIHRPSFLRGLLQGHRKVAFFLVPVAA
jgi:hypothetical protein